MNITTRRQKNKITVTKNEARDSFLYIFLIPNPKQHLYLPRQRQLFRNPKLKTTEK